jgi:hypothetical protein
MAAPDNYMQMLLSCMFMNFLPAETAGHTGAGCG